jgi:thiamine monophosphate synthase
LSKIHLSKHWQYFFVRLRLKLKFGKTSKSRSYSRLRQIYLVEDQDFDYYLIGTMYHSMTGDLYSGFYEDGIVAAIKNGKKKLIARGGTSVNVIEKTHKYGFSGIAFGSFIWESEAPHDTFLKILDEFKAHNIALE